jgi:hypothetical protein
MKEPKDNHDCAVDFLKSMRALSPTWDAKITALMEERGLNATQALGSLAAFALDTDQYLVVPDHPYFNDVHMRPTGSKMICPVCDGEFELKYPGQPVCSNQCAQAFYANKAVPA